MASDATTTIIVAALSSGAIATFLGAVINGAFTKRKLSAEATEIITNAASDVVTQLRTELDRARNEMNGLRAQQIAESERLRNEHRGQVRAIIEEHIRELSKRDADFQEERERWRHLLQLHVAWDWIAIEKLSQLNVTLPDPPPILPREAPELPAKQHPTE